MATDPRILSETIKNEMTDQDKNDTSLDVEEDLGVLGSDETDGKRNPGFPAQRDGGKKQGDDDALNDDQSDGVQRQSERSDDL